MTHRHSHFISVAHTFNPLIGFSDIPHCYPIEINLNDPLWPLSFKPIHLTLDFIAVKESEALKTEIYSDLVHLPPLSNYQSEITF